MTHPLPSEPKLVVPAQIYFFDTDAGGVVHNIAYLRLIEVARTHLAEHLGWPLKQMADSGLFPVVTRTEIDYLKPARLADHLEIHSRLSRLERIRFHLEFEIYRPSDSAKIVLCRQTMVTVQASSGRPKPAPEAWIQAYPQLVE
jgi:YbgC/YbaW family acyl-CoA thioester hydrolase